MDHEGSYKPSYSYQEPTHQDSYGQPRYTSYSPKYAYQNASGRDNYGNPTYDWWFIK